VRLAPYSMWPKPSWRSPTPPTSNPSPTTTMQRPPRASSRLTFSRRLSRVCPVSAKYSCSGMRRSTSARREAAVMKPDLRPIACSTATGSEGAMPRFSSSTSRITLAQYRAALP
jgi:hypothetical protein